MRGIDWLILIDGMRHRFHYAFSQAVKLRFLCNRVHHYSPNAVFRGVFILLFHKKGLFGDFVFHIQY